MRVSILYPLSHGYYTYTHNPSHNPTHNTTPHTQLHIGGAEDLERLRLEEAAVQRKLRLRRGEQRLGQDEETRPLEDIQQQRRELGVSETSSCVQCKNTHILPSLPAISYVILLTRTSHTHHPPHISHTQSVISSPLPGSAMCSIPSASSSSSP